MQGCTAHQVETASSTQEIAEGQRSWAATLTNLAGIVLLQDGVQPAVGLYEQVSAAPSNTLHVHQRLAVLSLY